jgi:hypothetical protein
VDGTASTASHGGVGGGDSKAGATGDEAAKIHPEGSVSGGEAAAVARALRDQNPDLTDQQAVDLAHMLGEVKKDPQTRLLLDDMKSGTGRELFQDFVKGMSQRDMVQGMAVSLEEIRMLDYLFQDPKRAFEEMEKDGMIEDHMVDVYRKDPGLLEDDTRKSVYFSFVSLSAAAGYM